MNLSKGDAVTYVALVTSALLQALEPWRKEAAIPPNVHPILSNNAWSYLPLVLLTIVGIIWLVRQLRTPSAKVEAPAANTVHSPARRRVCDFGKYEWKIAQLDPGEHSGGPQRFVRLSVPLKFSHNARGVTIRVNVLRPTPKFGREVPWYSWRPIESRDFFEGDKIDIIFATIAENRQNNGYYGDLRADGCYIGVMSRHLFEIDVFFDGVRENSRIYLENPPQQIYADPPEGLGKLSGIIVVQENQNVFDSPWIAESLAAVGGTYPPSESKPMGFGSAPLGTTPLGT